MNRTRAIACYGSLVSSLLLLISASCDAPAPTYDVPAVNLQLIPDVSTISTTGGPVFILAEVATSNNDRNVIILFETDTGTLTLLPGTAGCYEDGGALPVLADAAADAGGGARIASFGVGVPASALVYDPIHNALTTGALLNIPAGNDDVEVLAAAYEQPEAASCGPVEGAAIAFTALRIPRTEADAAPAEDGGTESDGPSDEMPDSTAPPERGLDASPDTGIDASTFDAD
ncbi:MAG: hypothetical protein ACLQVI_09885 [Polyangiaceae bacterium]